MDDGIGGSFSICDCIGAHRASVGPDGYTTGRSRWMQDALFCMKLAFGALFCDNGRAGRTR